MDIFSKVPFCQCKTNTVVWDCALKKSHAAYHTNLRNLTKHKCDDLKFSIMGKLYGDSLLWRGYLWESHSFIFLINLGFEFSYSRWFYNL